MSPPSLRNLKRGQISVSDINPPSKRTRSSTGANNFRQVRETSPNKNVHFPRDLILGPAQPDPRRRSTSPARSALRRSDNEVDSPSLQLLGEQAVASVSPTTRRRENTGKRQSAPKRKTTSRSVSQPSPDESLDVGEDVEYSVVLAGSQASVCDSLHELKSRITEFATSFPKQDKSDVLSPLLRIENQQLIRYIGLLAIGGKSGKEGWQALLSDSVCRHGLISGIIGRALKEKVFEELWFGAEAGLNERLKEQERSLFQQDGFLRSRQRASLIFKHGKKSIPAATLNTAVARVALQLERLLLPLWKQGGTTASWKKAEMRAELTAIVSDAADINHIIRKDFDTVYYWPPTFKDEEFEPERMECFNMPDMIRATPYDMKKTNAGTERPILRQRHSYEDTALVRVVCFPGLVSYQRGGGQLAQRELTSKKRSKATFTGAQDDSTVDRGFRTSILCKSTVLLQWGNQRALTREAGTSAHRKAMKDNSRKYEKDNGGFLELYDLFLQAVEQHGGSLTESTARDPRTSWIPSMGRLFSRSPSAQPEQS